MAEEMKISKEIAEKDFNDWCESCEIECDVDSMSEEDKTSFSGLKDRIVKAIMKGKCVVDGDKMQYTLSEKNEGSLSGKTITIDPPTSKTFMGIDGFKETQRMHKMASCMSAITGLDIGVFTKLWGKDFAFMTAVVTLFLSI